jgi:hypothetical protein
LGFTPTLGQSGVATRGEEVEFLLIIEDMNEVHMKNNVTTMSRGWRDKEQEDHDDHEHKEKGGGESGIVT